MKNRQVRFALLSAAYVLLALSAALDARAQSADVNFPTPVFSTEVSGRIAARDIGDARRTRHFYTFRGREGDVTVTVEASELIGDVDVFTSATLRPLVKFTLFGDATRVTKSFYVRSEETFVLRVEARANGDTEGTYRVTFGGSFAPAPAELANVEEPKTPTLSESTRGPGTRRVTTAGARIEEPKPEPTPTPVEEARAPEPQPTPTPRRNTARRGGSSGRSTRPSSRARGTTPAPQPKPSNTETADARPPTDDANAETPTAESKPAATPERAAPRRRNTRGSRGRASTDRPAADARPPGSAAPATPAPAAATGRLVIITLDGEIFERQMSTVRSVTVEKGQLVVTTLDGKTTRRAMSNVLRMSIEP
ncbi:MAG TPA: hypothetical protein VM914_08340 [Pyrinomonadaceae bacterium]|nr:hypothetical protein [Pyrinomonadaceae bacterium]